MTNFLAQVTDKNTSPSTFLILVFVLSIPFYLLGITGIPLPGIPTLPASALMGFVPMIAALILTHRAHGSDGYIAMIRRLLDLNKHHRAIWVLATLLFMPVVTIAEFGILRLTGSSVPLPQIAFDEAGYLFLALLIEAIGEELGWQGYAYPALRAKRNALWAALVLGAVWGLWHVIPYVQLGRSTSWIVWQSLNAIARRIVIVWLFENTSKSVLIAVLFHTMINLTWALFPIAGSYYDPFVVFLILAPAAGMIAFLWGPDTLARFRFSARGHSDEFR